MSPSTVTLIRHLSGFLAAFETLVNELKPQLDQLKQAQAQEQEKLKQL